MQNVGFAKLNHAAHNRFPRCQASRGLAHLHDRAIVHGDVSSANVLLKSTTGAVPPACARPAAEPAEAYAYGYVAKVCDFGLSSRLDTAVSATHVSGPAR